LRRRSATLAWSVIASAALHAAVAAVVIAERGRADAPTAEHRPGLSAVHVASRDTAPGPDDLLLPEALPVLPAASALLALVPHATLPPIMGAKPSRVSGGREGKVAATLLRGRERIGAMSDRQVNEFPREIDTPVRIREPIEVPYPAFASADGENAVVVWAVVDPDGTVGEVEVTEGSPEFAEPVVTAVKAARFTPATDRLRPIRYPIALEFRFASGRAPAPAVADAR
jgi:TonB family protein